jgi:hypothetical protein
VARILIVGCGCRGRALGRALSAEHAVRGTSRFAEGVAALEEDGIEGVVADPDRLATVVPALSGVTVVCWLMGSAVDSPEVNGPRLATFAEHLVDTPVRRLVYEAAGPAGDDVLAIGAQIVRDASRTWHIPVQVVSTDPSDHGRWLEAMKEAVNATF